MSDERREGREGRQGNDAGLRGSLGKGPGAARAPEQKVVVLVPVDLEPGREAKTHRLHKARIVIGSVVSADVKLGGDGLAPLHAVLEVDADNEHAATVYDLASRTGVFVNDEKVVTKVLKSGDVVTIGRHRLKFYLEDAEKLASKESVRVSEGRKLFMSPGEDLTPLLLQDEREVYEIFDYRPTQKPAVEIVMSWRGTILDVGHFVEEREVTVGCTRKCDFWIPPTLPAAKHPLVTRVGGQFWLNLDSQIQGVMQRKGRIQTVDELRSQARSASPSGQGVALQKDDLAKLSVGEIDFYVSFTAAPPRLKRRRLVERDPLLLKVLITSLLMTTATITALVQVAVKHQLDAEQLPERIATILYAPEKYAFYPKPQAKIDDGPAAETKTKPVEKPPEPKQTTRIEINPNPANANKKVPEVMDTGASTGLGSKTSKTKKGGTQGQKEAKEGKGARAKGPEGKRGKKSARTTGIDPQDKAKRPSADGGPGSGGSRSQVSDQGNVDMLKGASEKIHNLLGSSAEQLGKGGEKLKGFGGFDTTGGGGLALSGKGAGGGGDAATLGGLSNKGIGGGRVGTGQGAAGNGSGIAGGRARVVIRTGGPEEAVVMGSIDADAVEAALLAHKDEFRLCYEREINAENPKLAGRVGTSFVIGASGKVNQAGIDSTTLRNANTERCILTVIKRIQFPLPRGGGIVEVKYPFKYSPVGGR